MVIWITGFIVLEKDIMVADQTVGALWKKLVVPLFLLKSKFIVREMASLVCLTLFNQG